MVDFNQIANESRASIEHEDLKVLFPLIASINPKNILEIGTWKGYSAETWIKAFEPSVFVTIEKDEMMDDAFQVPNLHGEYKYLWGYDSQDEVSRTIAVDYVGGNNYDFLFIDGDHSLKGVTEDWKLYSQHVRKGGLIALHDVLHYNEEPEVNITPLWNELKKKYPYVEIKVGSNSTGIGVIWYIDKLSNNVQ